MFKFDKGIDHAQEFERLVIARLRSRGHQSHVIAALKGESDLLRSAASVLNWEELNDIAGDPARRDQIIEKVTAIAAGTLADTTWAGALASLQTLQSSWFASLRYQSMLDALVAGGMQPAPVGRKFPITAAVGTGYELGEVAYVPLTKFQFSLDTAVSVKAGGAVVVPDDMIRFGGALADNALGDRLRAVASIASDAVVANRLSRSISPLTSSGNARTDLRSAFEAILLSSSSRPIIFAAPKLCKQMALDGLDHGAPTFPDMQIVNGGSIGGVPVIPIDVLADYSTLGDTMLIVDATQVAGSAGGIEIAASNEADIQMVDAASGASSVVSMYQTNSTVLRAVRWFNVDRARESAVSVIEGCDYSSGSP